MSPEINFDETPDASEFPLVPGGKYTVEISNVVVKPGGNDEVKFEIWNLWLTITDGEQEGQKVFDSLSWGGYTPEKAKRAMSRIKLVCSRFGLKTEGSVNLQPEMLKGLRSIATVELKEEEFNGVKRMKNNIPFVGYEAIEEGATAGASALPEGVG